MQVMRESMEKRNKKPLTFLVLQTVINYNNNNSNFICTEIDNNKIKMIRWLPEITIMGS